MAHFRTALIASLALAVSACASDDTPGNTPDPDPGPTPQGTPDRPPLPEAVTLPIVFVHGFAGSAQQYESQAIRFVANGYPRARIRALDHDGVGQDASVFVAQVDGLVEQVRQEFGVQQVYLVGHSRGTSVSNAYMGDPARAAKVAKYISLDGGGCGVADGLGIPCLAPTQVCRAGAVNCVPMPGQAHVEVATSAESFVEQYKFLVGEAPSVVEIVRQDKPVELRGRAVNFPANTGRAGAILEIWKIDAQTGARQGGAPVNTFNIAADGEWGPLEVSPEQSYEMALKLPDSGTQHFYLQRYLRSSHFVRLLSGPADSPIRLNTNRGDNHAALIAIRMREWYATDDADKPGDESDILEIGTTSKAGDQPAINVMSSRMANGTIAIHMHDAPESPGDSTLGELTKLTSCGITCVAFQTTADLYMPAADPPNGTISIKNLPRGDGSKPQIINVPNWASTGHLITLQYGDYAQ